jgi:hypothetical protein
MTTTQAKKTRRRTFDQLEDEIQFGDAFLNILSRYIAFLYRTLS